MVRRAGCILWSARWWMAREMYVRAYERVVSMKGFALMDAEPL